MNPGGIHKPCGHGKGGEGRGTITKYISKFQEVWFVEKNTSTK